MAATLSGTHWHSAVLSAAGGVGICGIVPPASITASGPEVGWLRRYNIRSIRPWPEYGG